MRGRLHGRTLTLDGAAASATLLAPAAAATSAAGRGAARVAGDRAAVAIVVEFADAAVSCSDNQIGGLMWTGAQSVDGLYRETSYGALGFPYDVDGDGAADVVRVDVSHTTGETCDASAWAASADAAAQAEGVDLADYRHRIYVLPGNTSCSWAGLGSLGCGSVCRAWVATCGLPDVYAHELGHNLGMHHASTDDDNDGAYDCEYCDRSDFMGIGGVGWRQVNGAHKEQMGWLPPEAIADLTGQAAQTVTVSALTADPAFASFPQSVQVAIPGSSDRYVVTYRRRAGYDANLHGSWANKLNVHRWSGSGRTLFVAALADGQALSDPASGLTLTALTHDDDGATFLLGSDCTPGAPAISWQPAAAAGEPGQERTFVATIVNEDDASCAAAEFDVAADVPDGWTASISVAQTTLEPGASADVELTVTPPAGAADGDHAVGLALSGDVPEHDAASYATYAIAGDAPGIVDDLAAVARTKGFVVLTWTAPEPGASPVDGYRVYREGSIVATVSGPAWIDTRPCAAGSCTYAVVAVDSAGRASALGNGVDVAGAGFARKGPAGL